MSDVNANDTNESFDNLPTKLRGFSIVVHNVHDSDQAYWEQVFQKLQPKNCVISIEPYPKSNGHHMHVFAQWEHPRSKFQMLKYIKNAQKPENIDIISNADHVSVKGRIQVDQMRGTFQEATAYLTQELTKKDKTCGVPKLIKETLFPLKCVSCDFTGVNKYWFEEDYMDKTVRCHRCCYFRKLHQTDLSQTTKDEYFEFFHKMTMKLMSLKVEMEKKISA